MHDPNIFILLQFLIFNIEGTKVYQRVRNVPEEYFEPLSDHLYEGIKNAPICNALCEKINNEVQSRSCNAVLYDKDSNQCQLGRKCNICDYKNVTEKVKISGEDFFSNGK